MNRDQQLKTKELPLAGEKRPEVAKPELGEKKPLKGVEGAKKNIGWDDVFLPKKTA